MTTESAGRGSGASGNGAKMAWSRRIGWTSRKGYSPIQDRAGVVEPHPGDLPSVIKRVTQQPDPYFPRYLDEREVLRVTYQGDDRCQLRCPGCYTGERLERPGTTATISAGAGGRRRVPWDDFTGHVRGLGGGLQDFYLLGAEPTMDPEGSDRKLAWAAEQGLTVMSITNGAVPPARFDRTFGGSIERGQLYKLIVSLDSMDPAVNNELRGSPLAFERTIATIQRCVDRGIPVKVQMTVWPRNYPTILESVEKLWELGVRGFAFHCGSVEGVPDFLARGLDHLDPLAWRALCERLYEFRAKNQDELIHFNFPLLYFTEAELRQSVIGDGAQADAYLAHVDAYEAGQPSTKPFHACPAMDVPQVYVFANDGRSGRGVVSLCNVHSPDSDTAFAEYEPESGRWAVVQDPARNQMQRLVDSPHLCPAMPQATGGRTSDRVATERGDLYHACRYLGCNQVPTDQHQFGPGIYDRSAEFYRAVEAGRQAFIASGGVAGTGGGQAAREPYLARVRRITSGVLELRERTIAVLRDAVDVAGLDLESLAGLGFEAEVVEAVRAAEPVRAPIPIPLSIRPIASASSAGSAAACGACR